VRQQLTLFCAALVNDAFLRQSAFSANDRVCAPARQAAMMRLLETFFDLAEKAVAAGVAPADIAQMACVRPLQRAGEDIADAELSQFDELHARIDKEFAGLAARSETVDASRR
jgi:V/A-type H+-transporting ATPase subunit A